MRSERQPGPALDPELVARLHERAGAARWAVSEARFAAALQTAAGHAFAADRPLAREGARREVERFLEGLHLQDLALACACADGSETAWDHFVLELRPVLYRAADALEPGGGARELADSLYAELYGLHEQDGIRQSLFRYFHGRSSLATWLRAVLAQRYVDRVRVQRRIEPLVEENEPAVGASSPDPDRVRYLTLIQQALALAVAALSDRDRLRLGLYYAQQLTLAETGRLLKEHEATVSRQLARARKTMRTAIERHLTQAGLSRDEVARCFEAVADDAGPLDIGALLGCGMVQADEG